MLRVIPEASATIEYGWRRWVIAFGIALAPLLETVDSTIVNVALPTVQGNLGATIDEGAFVITAYLITNVLVIPLTPWLAERLGRRQYLTISIAGFTIASMFCGLSPNIETLIAMRIVQGFFGGGLIATTQSALRDLFPIAQANVSQAIFGVCIATGPIIGPLLGGLIVDNASWPWIFFVNLVPGLISGFVAACMLKNPHAPRRMSVDGVGILVLAVGVGCLQYMLDEGERKDWFDSGVITATACGAFAGIAGFVAWELVAKRPIVDLRALRDRSIWSGCLLGAGFGATLIAVNFELPQYLQGSLAFTPTLSGQYLLFRGVPVVLLAPAIGAALGANRVDPRWLIAAGLLFTGLGTGWIGIQTTAQSDFGTLVWPMVLAGVGTAFLIIPLLTVVVSSVSAERAPSANAFVTLSIQLGGSIASAIVVTLLDRRQRWHSATIASAVTPHLPRLQSVHADASTLFSIVQNQASILAYADMAYLVSALSFVLIPFVAVVRRPPKDKPVDAVAH